MLDRLLADQVASRGREGDSTLVHMAPEEINGLQALAQANGTSLTINPYTGYPEAKSLKKAFKSIGNAVGSVLKPVAKVLQPIAPILPFIPIPGVGPLSALAVKSILGGALGGMGKDGKFDLKRALASGALQYGIGSLVQGMGNAGTPGATPTSGPPSLTSNIDPAALEGMSKAQVASVIDAMPVTAPISAGPDFIAGTMMDPATGNVLPPAASSPVGGFQQSLPSGSGPMDYLKQTGSNMMETAKGAGNFFSNPSQAWQGFKAGMPNNPFTDKLISPLTAGTMALGGVMAVKTIDQLNAMKNQAQEIIDNPMAAKNEEDIAWAKGVLRDYPIQYRALSGEDVKKYGLAGGGIASLRDAVSDIRGEYGLAGGGQARFLSGGGDGMSDDIPAIIGGKQPARLADGEFVIPADVVSHMGNGSSKAGAKKLYAMMDKVRKARTGRTKQAPAIKTDRYMVA